MLEPLASLGELQPVEEIFKELSGRGLATREAQLAVFRAYCVAGSDQVQVRLTLLGACERCVRPGGVD